MATSGTYLWNPDLAEIVDEAYERCLIDPATLEVRHIRSARRSIQFMMVDWATGGYTQFKIERRTLPLVQGTQQYTLPAEIIDIVNIALRRDGSDTPVEPMSRMEWLDIPDKDFQGRPDRFFADKQRDAIELYLWTVPENSTDELIYDCLLRYEDATKAAETGDIPYYMFEAFASGLAAKLSEKFAPQLEDKLTIKAAAKLREGLGATNEQADVRIIPGSNTRRRRGSGRSYR